MGDSEGEETGGKFDGDEKRGEGEKGGTDKQSSEKGGDLRSVTQMIIFDEKKGSFVCKQRARESILVLCGNDDDDVGTEEEEEEEEENRV